MLGHYLSIACRNLIRNRFHAAVSIVGLALGLSCFLGAQMFASFVNGADRQFPSSDRIHTIYQSSSVQTMGLRLPFSPSTSALLADRLRSDFPQLSAVARARVDEEVVIVAEGQRSFQRVRYVEPAFLQIFRLPFVEGTAENAARLARSVLLTEDAAMTLFGRRDVVGRSIRLDETDETEVAGVISVPHPSHLGRSILGDESTDIVVVSTLPADIEPQQIQMPDQLKWLGFGNIQTYLLFPENESLTPPMLNEQLPEFAGRHVTLSGAEIAFEARHISSLVSDELDEILFGAFGLSVTDLLLVLGSLVLATASLNFVNLATARAAARAKEVGLRKAVGGRRSQIILQHLLEAVLVTTLAVVLALIALQLAIAAVNDAFELSLAAPWSAGAGFWVFAITLTLAVGAAAGAYPALVLARVQPVMALRAGAARAGSKLMRTLLIGLQFTAASFLLIAVTVMAQQNAELRRTGLGLGEDPLVVIPIQLEEVGIDAELFRSRLSASPYVKRVTGANVAPWQGVIGGTGFSRTPDVASSYAFTQTQDVSFEYFASLGTKVLAGRSFSADRSDAWDPESGRTRAVVIDRLAVEQFGWSDPAAAVGQLIYSSALQGKAQPLSIIGVVEHAPPRVFGWGSRAFVYQLDVKKISLPIIQISRENIPAALAEIDAVWQDLAPETPIKREFADERFDRSYRFFANISGGFTILASFAFAIALMGLFGMISFIASRRRHEISVRKILGAGSLRILGLLLWDFLKPVLAANIIAWPLAFIAARTYVNLFIHPLPLTPAPFLLSLGVTMLIAAVVVVHQAAESARVKPAVVLRQE